MRQIYTSPRYENVERVVALLDAANIDTTVRNRRDWQGDRWKRFSYTQRGESESWAQVWVTDSNDQTRAREILRDAGLEPPPLRRRTARTGTERPCPHRPTPCASA